MRRHVVIAIRGFGMPVVWHQTTSRILPRVKALVISHEDDGGPGLVGARLEERGVTLDVAQIARGRNVGPDRLPPLDGYDAVVSLGCTEAVFDRDAVGSWIDPELDLLRAAHANGVPVFGICFGGQALAAALGALVERAPTPEIGWFELELTAEGTAPFAAGPWMVWHLDRFSMPAGATEIARTSLCTACVPCGPQHRAAVPPRGRRRVRGSVGRGRRTGILRGQGVRPGRPPRRDRREGGGLEAQHRATGRLVPRRGRRHVTGSARPTVPSGLDIVSHDVYAAGIPHAAFAALRRDVPGGVDDRADP